MLFHTTAITHLLYLIHYDLQLRAPEHDHGHCHAIHRYEEEGTDVDADNLV